jgi:hypothetical protein
MITGEGSGNAVDANFVRSQNPTHIRSIFTYKEVKSEMTEKEIQDIIDYMKSKRNAATSKKKALEFLKELGVITEKGNLKEKYSGLCMLGDQD